ncbi:hypothetical protein IAU59_002427 [Kwoniella sp. CBS 9459]
MSASPIPRRHSEMPQRATPPRRISTFTDAGAGPSTNVNGGGTIDERRRGSAAAPSSSTIEQRRARREQLRNFYGIKADAEGEGGEKGAGQGKEGARPKGDPLDIDSPAFDPVAYYEHLISKETLSGLMKRSSTLSSDIGNLEGSRHSLVYNHHHQLFAAGDTISHLNSRTPQLLSIVTELQSSFSSISQLVDSIALPETSGTGARAQDQAASESTVQDEGFRAKKVVERLRLMICAEEPAGKIREVYDTSKDVLERIKDHEEYRQTIEQVKQIISGSPPVPKSANDGDESR